MEGGVRILKCGRAFRIGGWLVWLAALAGPAAGAGAPATAPPGRPAAGADEAPPPPPVEAPAPAAPEVRPEAIGVIARDITAWREGDTWCYLCVGEARAVQGDRSLAAEALVLWFDEAKARGEGVAEVHLYGSGNVLLYLADAMLQRDEAFVRWRTSGRVDVEARGQRRVRRRAGDPLFLKAASVRDEVLAAAGRREAVERLLEPHERAQPILQIFATTREGYTQRSVPPAPGTTRRTTVFLGGVDVVYKDPARGLDVEIAADNLVLWSTETPADRSDTAPAAAAPERRELEVYAEGNVAVFALGGTLRAPRAYYNLTTGQALLVDSRVETFSKARKVPVIYEAERVRQFGRGVLTAQNAHITSCDYGLPHYYLYSRRVTLTDQTVTDARGEPMLDAAGEVITRQVATTWDNTLRIAGIPFFYLPYAEHDLTRPETGVRRVRIRHDGDFGFQVLTESDLYYFLPFLLGQPEPGTDLRLRLDYMSERGVAGGVNLEYDRPDYLGYVNSYFLRDQGLDHGDFEPPTRDRGRFLWRHRHDLAPDLLLQAELSWISDEAFLNEYFAEEFREGKDQETVLYLKKQEELWAATFLTKVRLNDFQSETDYLPQFGLNLLGVPLFDDTVTWISQSEIGGVRLLHGDPARTDLAPIPESQEASIFRAETRNELYRPFDFWIFRVDPFVQGRAGYFSERAGELGPVSRVLADGSTVTGLERGPLRSGAGRFAAAAGARVSTQFWRVFHQVKSEFWNIEGLRHIITPQFAYFDLFGLNVDSDDLVQFDAVDDVDLLRVLEMKLRQRLQTHRGVGEKRRVVDWVTLNLTTNVYPDADRDNRGESLGHVGADLEWRVSEVLSVVSEAKLDPHANQLGTFSVGIGLDQDPRYAFFIGQRFINASDSNVTILNLALQLNEKWRFDWLSQYEWSEAELIQNRVRLQRDLHDFILFVGIDEDRSRDNVIVFVEVIPKGLPELGLRFR